MPIRFIVTIESLKDGKFSVNTSPQTGGEVTMLEIGIAKRFQEAFKAINEEVSKHTNASYYAEGDSAYSLKKVLEKERKEANRLLDDEEEEEEGGG